MVLSKYAPGVVVNDSFEILQFRGARALFIVLAVGIIQTKLEALAEGRFDAPRLRLDKDRGGHGPRQHKAGSRRREFKDPEWLRVSSIGKGAAASPDQLVAQRL